MTLTKNKIEELLTEAIVSWFKKGIMTNKELADFYSKYRPITAMGLRHKLIKEMGEEEYKKIKESHIKHPNMRKYYERRTN